jgi:broad specificity phosphatase PhoE
MKVYILRHGETELNTKGVMQGSLDAPLNQNGRDLAAVTGRAMKGIHFDSCITSPLCRAAETAEIVLRESGNYVPVTVDRRLMELSCGDMEGKPLSDLGDAGKIFFTDPFRFISFPNGETIRALCDRTQAFLKELIARDDGKTYLVSTHGCAMRAMVNYLNPNPQDFWFGHVPYNCSMTILNAERGSVQILELNKVFYDLSLTEDPMKRYVHSSEN